MRVLLSKRQSSRLLPFIAGVLAIIIFLFDTFSPLGMAVAVLYVLVILIVANFCEWRGILLVAIGCGLLALTSFSISHGSNFESTAFARCVVSIFAIAVTTFLTWKNKSAEMVLREQANLLDVTHDAVLVRDTNDVIRYWNRGAEELYGWSSSETLGQVTHELMQTVFPEPIEIIRNILIGSSRWEGELSQTKRDGTRVTVASRWSVQWDQQGNPVAFLETNTDVSERKQAEDALRRSEAYLAEAQRLSLTGSFGWRVANQEIVWSNETRRIFQLDPEVKPTLDFIVQRTHPSDVAGVRDIIERAAREEQDWDYEHRLLMPDGSIKFVNVVARATRDASGNVEFVGAIMDVTATKRAEVALQQAQSDLAHVNRITTLGEMTASIAHEVSQPISAIVTNASAGLRWLTAQPPALEEAKQTLIRICNNAKRAGEVVAGIRALAKKMPIRKDWLNVNDVVTEIVALTRGEVEKSNVSVSTALAGKLPPVFGDRIQLQQVVLNLVVNAIEAMSAEYEQRRELWINSKAEGAGILVSVSDSGPGIDPEHADHLFDAFHTTKPDGIGMGLAICRSIIEAHDGRLWVSPNTPRGAVFQFSLPNGED
jgi:PAS domain S-box-containing protein